MKRMTPRERISSIEERKNNARKRAMMKVNGFRDILDEHKWLQAHEKKVIEVENIKDSKYLINA